MDEHQNITPPGDLDRIRILRDAILDLDQAITATDERIAALRDARARLERELIVAAGELAALLDERAA